MASNPTPLYQRLPGSGYRQVLPTWAILLLFFVVGIFALLLRGKRVRLWQGAEHLLVVEWDGYRESYKRFRYADIQSVVLLRTADWLAVPIVASILLALFLWIAAVATDPVGRGILAGIAALFAAVVIGYLVAGPTCRCRITTAVQTEELVSLRRLRTARRVLDRLRPLILAAQGGGVTAQPVAATTAFVPEPAAEAAAGSTEGV